MTKSETERTAGTGQTEAAENPELVRMVVESSAECTKPFKKLPEDVQAKIIDGMTEALAEDELRFRGHWNIEIDKVRDWKNGTNTALYIHPNHDFDPVIEVKVTSTAIMLAQLIVSISAEFNMNIPDILDPVRRVFRRSADTLESGFNSFSQTKEYMGRKINSGPCEQGATRTTKRYENNAAT